MEEKKPELIVKVGAVIRAFVEDTTPPKIKRFIVVGINEPESKVAIVYINSEYDPEKIPPHLQGSHTMVETKHCPFLDYDSFVDCSDLREKGLDKIKKSLNKNPSIQIGTIPAQQLDNIMLILKKSKIISTHDKKRFGLSF